MNILNRIIYIFYVASDSHIQDHYDRKGSFLDAIAWLLATLASVASTIMTILVIKNVSTYEYSDSSFLFIFSVSSLIGGGVTYFSFRKVYTIKKADYIYESYSNHISKRKAVTFFIFIFFTWFAFLMILVAMLLTM